MAAWPVAARPPRRRDQLRSVRDPSTRPAWSPVRGATAGSHLDGVRQSGRVREARARGCGPVYSRNTPLARAVTRWPHATSAILLAPRSARLDREGPPGSRPSEHRRRGGATSRLARSTVTVAERHPQGLALMGSGPR